MVGIQKTSFLIDQSLLLKHSLFFREQFMKSKEASEDTKPLQFPDKQPETVRMFLLWMHAGAPGTLTHDMKQLYIKDMLWLYLLADEWRVERLMLTLFKNLATSRVWIGTYEQKFFSWRLTRHNDIRFLVAIKTIEWAVSHTGNFSMVRSSSVEDLGLAVGFAHEIMQIWGYDNAQSPKTGGLAAALAVMAKRSNMTMQDYYSFCAEIRKAIGIEKLAA